MVGPTQSGKTTALAVPAILGWPGPVLAASVKTDLLRDTWPGASGAGSGASTRPGATGRRPSRVVARSPACGTGRGPPGGRRPHRGGPRPGTTADGEFWYATAAKLLAPLLFAAALGGRTMGDVVRWVDTQEVAEVADILEEAGGARGPPGGPGHLAPRRPPAQLGLHHRRDRARAVRRRRAARPPAPAPPRPAAPACGGSRNTLYLCAPAHDQRRLRAVFAALVKQVLDAAFARPTRSGRPLDPPLLVVLDEAANIAPLAELDGLAATCAVHGIQLVTVWQDLAQVTARYGARAPTVLNNHRAKLFLPGIADPDTLDHASRLVGDEEVVVPSVTRDPTGRRSTTSTRRRAAAAARGPALPAPGTRGPRLRLPAAGPPPAAARGGCSESEGSVAGSGLGPRAVSADEDGRARLGWSRARGSVGCAAAGFSALVGAGGAVELDRRLRHGARADRAGRPGRWRAGGSARASRLATSWSTRASAPPGPDAMETATARLSSTIGDGFVGRAAP